MRHLTCAATAGLLVLGACSGGSGHSTPPVVTRNTLVPDSIAALPTPASADPDRPPVGIDVSGTGNGRVPASGTVNVGDGWAVAYAWACPLGTAAASPQHVPLRVSVAGADDAPALATGDTGSGEQAMPKGGQVSAEVTSTSLRCRWRVIFLGRRAP